MAKRAVVATMAVVVVIAGAAFGAQRWWTSTSRSAATTPTRVPTATTAVVRTSLSTTVQLSATLGYAGSYLVSAPGDSGTITALPQPGQVISQGQRLYEVDGNSVYLFYGARPSWRTLASGVTPGADVNQLEHDLTTLGFAGPANLAVDDTFTWATSEAIRRWQQATGQPVTGSVALGRIVFEPTAIRVVNVVANSGGQNARGSAVLSATSTTPIITASVPPAQTVLVHSGDAVTITMPGGTRTPGRVESLSTVAQEPSASSTQGPQGPNQVTVPALISLTDPKAAGNLDQAPVTVNVTDRTVSNVLAVPITALVALSGGGYAVWVDTDSAVPARHLVPVTPGLFATTLVQVTASGLEEGDLVEVPSQ